MSFFKKLKDLFGGEKTSLQKPKGILLTEKQLTIREWLYTLSPEWQEILRSERLSDDHSDEELWNNFKCLTDLNLSGNTKIRDIMPVGELMFLKKLDLEECRITDLSSLAKLSDLEELTLTNTPVKDLSPLTPLSHLRVLYIGGRDFSVIDNIEVLANLYVLEELYIANSLITSIKVLENCTALKKVYVHHCPLQNLDGLENCTTLERLNVDYTSISSLEPIKSATQLKYLSISHCEKITDISIMKSFTELEELDITNIPINDLTPLHGLKNLTELFTSKHLTQQIKLLKVANPTCKIAHYTPLL